MTDARSNLKNVMSAIIGSYYSIGPRSLAENAMRLAALNYFNWLYNRLFMIFRAGLFSFSDNFWASESAHMEESFKPYLQNTTQMGVVEGEQELVRLKINFDPTLVHEEAAKWASEYVGELVKELTDTNKDIIKKAVEEYIKTPGADLGDLAKMLKPAIENNDYRANMIAATETTRAFSEGNNIAYQAAGIPPMILMSPLHPNCRCGQRVVRVGEEMLVVWETDQDEYVCHKPIQTNTSLGIVNGCSSLNDVVISKGKWFGHSLEEVKNANS